MADLIRRKQPGEAWETAVDTGGGGSGGEVRTYDLATDPNSFQNRVHDDNGSYGIVIVTWTVVALDGDGETFGTADGDITVATGYLVSAGGVAYESAVQLGSNFDNADVNDDLSDIGQWISVMFGTPEFSEASATIMTIPDFTIYAGANHPTADLRVDVQPLISA